MGLLDLLSGLTCLNLLATLLVLLAVYYLKPILFKKFPNIPGPTPWPVFGNMLEFFKKRGAGIMDIQYFKKYGKMYRMFEGRVETIVIADTDILKQILIKDFGDFKNRRVIPLRGVLKKGLFDSTDHDWERLRHLLTPSFTSGKLKKMIPLIQQCTDNLVANLEEYAKRKEAAEMKKMNGAFAMDVIASTAFGLSLDSQRDVNNPFLTNALKLSNLSFTSPLVFMAFFLPFMIPLLEKMGYVLGGAEPVSFFSDFIQRTINDRQQDKKSRVDFLQLMLDAEQDELDKEGRESLEGVAPVDEQEKTKGFTTEEILAQGVLFFLAAYDTTSNAMSFLMYTLANHPEAQEKLHEEVVQVMRDYKEANYDALSKMTYMDMCIQETLRLYPPVGRVDRRTSRDVTVGDLFIPADTVVVIPIFALHNDPEVFPEPREFRPERFANEEKSDRNQFSYLPFGLGPRHCIGQRLALMEIKLAFTKLVQKYRFLPSEYRRPAIIALIIFLTASIVRPSDNRPGHEISSGSWSELNQVWAMYVYSAVYDDRHSLDSGPVVRLLVVADKGIETDKTVFFCQLDYGTKVLAYETVQIFESGIGVPRENNRILKEYIFSCPLNARGIPQRVGITESSLVSPVVWIPVEVPAKPKQKDFICSCVSTSFAHIDPYRIIEWMELHRILGISHVSIYNHSLSRESSNIFEQYAKEGFVHLRQTPNFLEGTRDMFSIHIHMSANINDCVLRNMHRCKKIMITDLDEAIIPVDKRAYTYKDLLEMADKISKYPHPARSFTFYNCYFFTNLPDDETVPEGMVMLRHRRRIDPNSYGFATKSVIDPRACINMHSHFCWNITKSMDKKGHTFLVTPNLAKTHHYKPCRRGLYPNNSANCSSLMRSAVTDDAILRYKDRLIENTEAQAAKFGIRKY